MRVEELLSARFPSTIADVVQLMNALERALPRDDGVVAFVRLYRAVTEAVDEAVRPGGEYADTRFCRWLDVVFANSFFRALREATQRRPGVPKAWEPLIEARSRPGVLPIQFALAGMNAHINHDLAIAVVQTGEEQGIIPRRGSPQHRDFERVNTLLEVVEGEAKQFLVTGIIGELDNNLGRVDDIIAIWKIGKARDTAWTNAEILWQLQPLPLLKDKFLQNLGRLVGLSSKGLLVRTR